MIGSNGHSLNVEGLSFPAVNLAFAWTQAPDIPLILGQANFFFEFDVCFFRARSEFEVCPQTDFYQLGNIPFKFNTLDLL